MKWHVKVRAWNGSQIASVTAPTPEEAKRLAALRWPSAVIEVPTVAPAGDFIGVHDLDVCPVATDALGAAGGAW